MSRRNKSLDQEGYVDASLESDGEMSYGDERLKDRDV
jgi:hypothetical protein